MLYGYVLDKIEPGGLAGLLVSNVASQFGSGFGNSKSADPATVAAVSLIFGLVYYAIAFALDRTGRPGVGVAFLYGAFGATVTGIGALAIDVKQVGTDIVLIVLGALIASFAARSERRFTTWSWIGAVPLGVALIIAKAVGSGHTAVLGVVFIVFGIVPVAVAGVLARALGESDELTPSPSGAVH